MKVMQNVGFISVVFAMLFALPVNAQSNQSDNTGTNTFSDITGGNIFNPSDITGTNVFGGRPPNLETTDPSGTTLAALISALQAAIATLLSSEGTSSETQEALRRAEECLTQLNQQDWDCFRNLDRDFQQIATNLNNDITAANQACNAGDQAACTRLSNLITQTEQFLNSLESFRATVIERGQVSRTF